MGEKIVVLSATDEENPVTQTEAVMTVSENMSRSATTDMTYYSYNNGTLEIITLTEELIRFLSVIAGEAIDQNSKTQKAVAHTIMNRVREPRDAWSSVTCVNDVLTYNQYNAMGTPEYNKCKTYFENRNGNATNQDYENLIEAVLPIYLERESDFTCGAHYIFNINISQGFLQKLEADPCRYVKCGPFEGISDTKYRIYRCLW